MADNSAIAVLERVFMHANEKIIRDFYAAFAKLDAAGMKAQYHDDIAFSDPAFPMLKGVQANAMWAMLCERAKEFELTLVSASGDDAGGRANWEAKYLYSGSGRMVHNKIEAVFSFKDGKIIRHVDRFDLWNWAGQALGAPGKLLGWFGPFKGLIRKKANKTLLAYMEKRGL
jgi:ketosteroid isomerase-like protein